MYETKPGAADGPKDRNTHYNDCYDRPSRESRTIQKKVFGLDNLSKKEILLLENSTDDGMKTKVAYSLNKNKRWEMVKSPESLIEKVASVDQAYPIAAANRAIVGNGYTNRAYSEKAPNQEIKSIRVQSGNGADFLSLRDSLMDKPTTSEKKPKPKRGQSLIEFVETPSILYCIEDHHSDELFFRRLLGKSKVGNRTSKKVKTVDLDESEDEFDEDTFDYNESKAYNNDTPKPSTLGDFLVSKSLKIDKKKRSTHSFEIIDEISELPSKNTKPKTLENTAYLASASKTQTHFINIDTDCLTLPNFEEFDFMFDFSWLNEDKTRCLFIIPKGCDDVLTNFTSILLLELIENKKKRLRVTAKAVHEIYIPMVSGNPHKALNEIEAAIRKLWEQGVLHLNNKNEDEPSLTFYQPQTSIFSQFTPMGDYALLGLNKVPVSSDSENDDLDFENIESSSCKICSHNDENNLTTLKCGHTFCRYCSETFIKKQITYGTLILSCHECTTPLEPSFILISSPLLLLQAHLRFQFLKQEGAIECPNGCGVAFVDSSKFNGVQCSKCKSVFCLQCKHEPHFPLSCEQMELWEARFFPHYVTEMKGETICNCPYVEEVVIYNSIRKKDCRHQKVDYWKNLINIHPYYRNPHFLKAIEDNFTSSKSTPMKVTAAIASVCVEARYKRMNWKYLKNTIKEFGKVSNENSKDIRETLITALHFLEFGFAWLYFSRKHKSIEFKSIKGLLYNLKASLVEMETRLLTNKIEDAMEKISSMSNLFKSLVEKF